MIVVSLIAFSPYVSSGLFATANNENRVMVWSISTTVQDARSHNEEEDEDFYSESETAI